MAESPSTDRVALDACAAVLVRQLQDAGAVVRRVVRRTDDGPCACRVAGGRACVLLVGHFDTVWPVGQIARMPVEERDGQLRGPGVLDMKAGLAIGMTAARVLCEASDERRPTVRLLATSDEEVGSATSRAAIERLAPKARR